MSARIVAERELSSRVVQLQLVFRSGSLTDPAGLSGLASFTGRALLRGTRARSYRELTETVERLGAGITARVDHGTTVFRASVLARNLEPFLALLAEILTQPAFDPAEMEVLRGILQGELRASLQEPQELAMRACLGAAYAGTPAERVPEGTAEGIARIRPADLAAFFGAHYGAANLVVAAMSPYDPADVTARISGSLAALPAGVLDARPLPAPTFSGRQAVIVDREGMSTCPVFIATPGVGDADPDLPALEAGNFVFGEDFTARLMQVLRAENGWTYGVSSGYRQLVSPKAEPSLFSIYLFPSAEYAAQAIPRAVSMLEEYARQGVTPDELAKSREALGNSYAFKIATAEQRLALRVRELLTGRKIDSPADHAARLSSLELAELNAIIARRMPLERLLVAAVGDAAALGPVFRDLPGMGRVEVVRQEEA